jgi:dTDP-4-amino-4,6-dideoxygalactose transaminase
MYYLLLNNPDARPDFIQRLNQRGIHTVFHYVPLHNAPAGRRYGRVQGNMATTEQVSERLVRLPLWLGIEQDQPEIIRQILEAL